MCWSSSFFMLIGRLLLAVLFLVSVYGKVYGYDATVAYMASKNLPAIPLLLGLAIIIEFLGGLSLLLGYKVRFMAIILILYLIPVTYFMHNFWTAQDPHEQNMQMFHFLKNVAIIGGLFYVVANGAGYLGCDRCGNSCKKDETRDIK
jgi:putative oxidoreductase